MDGPLNQFSITLAVYFHRVFCVLISTALKTRAFSHFPSLQFSDLTLVARELWSPSIHGSLHILVNPVTCGCGEKSSKKVKNPRVEWANRRERGDGGLRYRNDEINLEH